MENEEEREIRNQEEMPISNQEVPEIGDATMGIEEKKTGKKKNKKKRGKFWLVLFALLAVVFVGAASFLAGRYLREESQQEAEEESPVITVATLDEILNISELSTFTSVYNGVAQVMDEEDPEKVKYYVSYEAKIYAGIPFDSVAKEVNNAAKQIRIKVPEVRIINTSVDISSLDFIFNNEKANSSSITEEAFRACEEDLKQETETQSAILELARQNAVNVLTALTKPIVQQLAPDYQLIVE